MSSGNYLRLNMYKPIYFDGYVHTYIICYQHLQHVIFFDNENYDSSSSSSRGQRAIGVVYNPKYERFGNYVPTVLSKRYDSLIFIDNTNALSPLHLHPIKNKDLPETFPTGV